MSEEQAAVVVGSELASGGVASSDYPSIPDSPLATLLEHPTASDIDPQKVREAFKESNVWILGPKDDSKQSDVDILHYTIDDESGKESVMLPAFTSADALRQALIVNDEWRAQNVLHVQGGELLPLLQADVTVIVDPWTHLEFRFKPSEV